MKNISRSRFYRILALALLAVIIFASLIPLLGPTIPAVANLPLRTVLDTSTGPGSIAGTVTDADGAPIAGAAVTAYRFGRDVWFAEKVTDADAEGRYALEELQVGLYKIGANVPAGLYLTTYNDNQSNINLATEIPIAGGRVDDVDITLISGGEMKGTITLEGPLQEYGYNNMQLSLYESESGEMKYQFSSDVYRSDYNFSDFEDGVYHLQRLLPGEYKACASIKNSYRASTYILRECYDAVVGALPLQDAVPLSIRSDAVLSNIDFVLGNDANYGQISGQISDNTGSPVEGANIIIQSVIESDEPYLAHLCGAKSDATIQLAARKSTFEFCTKTDDTGGYSFPYIVPGRYTVGVQDPSSTYAPAYHGNTFELEDAIIVELTAEDELMNIDVTLSPASRITGTVSVQGVGSAPWYTRVSANRIGNDEHQSVELVSVDQFTGEYELTGLPAGTYSVTVSSSTYEQVEDAAQIVDVAESVTVTNINLSIADGLYNGVLQGQVMHEGVPLEGIRVELLGPETAYPAPIYFTETDDDGRFKIEGLGSGATYLGFVDQLRRYVTQFYSEATVRVDAEPIYIDENEIVTIGVEMQEPAAIDGQVGVPTNLDVSQEPSAPETQWTDTIFMPFVRQ